MPQFDSSSFLSQSFWLFIFLGSLYLINYFFVIPKIYKIFQDRKNKIDSDYVLSAQAKVKFEAFLEKRKALNLELENELSFIKNHYELRLVRYLESKQDQLKGEILQIEKDHLKEIEQFYRDLIASEKKISNEISESIIKKILFTEGIF
ncbi:MAG: hypothetical protein ISN64_02845 [Rickettsia sp.]|nr:hypothetical protein [Rickettsia sp.]